MGEKLGGGHVNERGEFVRGQDSKSFDPKKAKRVGSDGRVENVPFTEMQTQASVLNSLNNLQDLLQSASAEDYDAAFGSLPPGWLQKYKDMADQISMNLRRIIETKSKK